MRLLVGRAGPPRCRLSIAPPACEKSDSGSHRPGRPCPGSHPTEFPASEDGLLLATSVLRVSLVTRPRLGKDARNQSTNTYSCIHVPETRGGVAPPRQPPAPAQVRRHWPLSTAHPWGLKCKNHSSVIRAKPLELGSALNLLVMYEKTVC